jgi:hypothetical protein
LVLCMAGSILVSFNKFFRCSMIQFRVLLFSEEKLVYYNNQMIIRLVSDYFLLDSNGKYKN